MALTKIDDRGLKTPVDLLDNEKIRLGTGNDLEIYHDGSNSYLQDAGTGALRVQSNDARIINAAGSEDMARFIENGSVELYYDNNEKLSTESWGVEVTGTLRADVLNLLDNQELKIGEAADLQLYHDGSNNWIDSVNNHPMIVRAGTGNLYLQGGEVHLTNEGGSDTYLKASLDGAVELYYDDVKQCETVDGGMNWADGKRAYFGNSSDLQIYHDGSNSYISDNGTGKLRLTTSGTGAEIELTSQGGSEYLAQFIQDGAVKLYYDGGTYTNAKLETMATGIEVNGRIDLRGDAGSQARILFYDGDGGDDYQLRVDDSEFYVRNATDSRTDFLIDGAGNVGIGAITGDVDRLLHLESGSCFMRFTNPATSPSNGDIMGMLEFETKDSNGSGVAANIRSEIADASTGACSLLFSAGTASSLGTKMEIQNTGNVKIESGSLGVGCTPDGSVGTVGSQIGDSWGIFNRATSIPLYVHRSTSDGTLISFYAQGSSEGNITVSGTTVSLTGGHLSRWSQIKGLSTTDKSARPTIYQGTVMSNLDDLCVWNHAEVLYKEGDEIPEGKAVGDVKKAAYTENNQQLNMTKVSDTVGDKDVAGVFWTWDDDDDEIVNDFYIAMTGDMVIRVAGSTTVARGDLLESAGDGTAKPQSDDIVRSKTIAKIISTNSTATYPDGSKAYPCVLMAC